jgi:hypothetical protein
VRELLTGVGGGLRAPGERKIREDGTRPTHDMTKRGLTRQTILLATRMEARAAQIKGGARLGSWRAATNKGDCNFCVPPSGELRGVCWLLVVMDHGIDHFCSSDHGKAEYR